MLAEFIFSSWKACAKKLLGDIELFVAHAEQCHRIAVVGGVVTVSPVAEVTCYHEEADTRMILHASHASAKYSAVAIRSPDTDVMVLALAYAKDIDCNLLFMTGTG